MSLYTSLLWLVPAFVSCALLAFHPMCSIDVWWHLAAGRWMVEHMAIPHTEVLVYGAEGKPVVYYSWTAQVLFYLVERVGGVDGLVLLRMLLGGVAGFVFSFLAVRRGAAPWLAGICGVAMCTVSAVSFYVRPFMFSGIYAGLMLILLRKPTRNKILLALLVQLLWANVHTSFMLGLVILALSLFDETLRRRRETQDGSWATFANLKIWGWVPVFAAVCLVNVYGVGLFETIYKQLTLKWDRNIITEMKPMEFIDIREKRFELFFFVVWGVVLAGIVRTRKVYSWTDLILLALFTWQSIHVRRFLYYWGFLAVAPLSVSLGSLLSEEKRSRKLIGVALGLLAAVCMVTSVGEMINNVGWGGGVNRKQTPIGLADFLNKNEIKGKIACAAGAGGYIAWAVPGAKPLLDARYHEHDPQTVKAFVDFGIGRSGWRKAIPAPGGSDVIVIGISSVAPIWELFDEWGIAYWDDSWQVLLRRKGKYAHVLKDGDCSHSQPTVFPRIYSNLSKGEIKDIEAQYRKKIEEIPDLGGAYYGLALVNMFGAMADLTKVNSATGVGEKEKLVDEAHKKLEKALFNYHIDCVLNMGKKRSFYGKAVAYFILGDFDKSVWEFRKSANISPVSALYAVEEAAVCLKFAKVLNYDNPEKIAEAQKTIGRVRDVAKLHRARILSRYKVLGKTPPKWLME